MSAAVASRYARALVDVIFDPKVESINAEQALVELKSFKAMLDSSSDLSNGLLSPAVAPARKRAVIARFADMLPLAKIIRNFLYVIIDHRRTAMLGGILEAIQAQLDERMGIARAQISSAIVLGDADKARIQESLERRTGKKVQGQFTVNPELIGGVMVRVGSTIYDGSVRGTLVGLRKKLVAE